MDQESTSSPLDKTLWKHETEHSPTIEVDEIHEALEGYVLDPSRYPNNAAGLKLSTDGRHVLIPQPTDSPDDPLNWSAPKKAIILASICYIATLADYTGGTAIIAVIPQSLWVLHPVHTNSSPHRTRADEDEQRMAHGLSRRPTRGRR